MPAGSCSLMLSGHLHGGQICIPTPTRQGAALAQHLAVRGRRRLLRRDRRGRLARYGNDASAVAVPGPARGLPAATAAQLSAAGPERSSYTRRSMADTSAGGPVESVHSPSAVSPHLSCCDRHLRGRCGAGCRPAWPESPTACWADSSGGWTRSARRVACGSAPTGSASPSRCTWWPKWGALLPGARRRGAGRRCASTW